MSHRSGNFANCFEQPFSFRAECTRRDVGGKTRRDRSVSAVDPIDRDSCAKKTFGFLRIVKRDFFVPYLKKKNGKTRSSIASSRENQFVSLSLSLCLAVHRIELYTDLLSEEFLCFDSYIKIN